MRKTTWIIDIDGTIFDKAKGADATTQWHGLQAAVRGALEFVNQCEKNGDYIVLMTARKECLRTDTEYWLKKLGFYWDQLVMGVTNGPRIVVNDGPCGHILLKSNEGFENVWNTLGCWASDEAQSQADAFNAKG